jgi:hypothetical protein
MRMDGCEPGTVTTPVAAHPAAGADRGRPKPEGRDPREFQNAKAAFRINWPQPVHTKKRSQDGPQSTQKTRKERLAPEREEGARVARVSGFGFSFARDGRLVTVAIGLSGGVTVAQGPLEAFVMVRIHAGQPVFLSKSRQPASLTQIPHRFRPSLMAEK